MKTEKRSTAAPRPERQVFEWGSVRWIHDEADFEGSTLLVGHVTFLPFKGEKEHHHTGDEQILYVISGAGSHSIDGVRYELKPGDTHHIDPYVTHSVVNETSKPLEMIIVYHTNKRDIDHLFPHESVSDVVSFLDIRPFINTATVQRIQDKLSAALGLAIAIYDSKGTPLTDASNVPEFCRHLHHTQDQCPLFARYRNRADLHASQLAPCHYDLVQVSAPIVYGDQYIGEVVCGPVILNEHADETIEHLRQTYGEKPNVVEAYRRVPTVTKGRLQAVIDSVRSVNDYIVETAITRAMKKTIEEKNTALMRSEMDLLRAQTSPHFLFNTLGVIAQLAYMQGAKDAAETTYALTNMLRTSIKEAEHIVPLSQEIAYIRDYIFIQDKRSSHTITLVETIDPDLYATMIPFLLLQTFVENAVKHALPEVRDSLTITIEAERSEGNRVFTVRDDGRGMDSRTAAAMCTDLTYRFAASPGDDREETYQREQVGVGTANLHRILRGEYGSEYAISVASDINEGTTVSVRLPIPCDAESATPSVTRRA